MRFPTTTGPAIDTTGETRAAARAAGMAATNAKDKVIKTLRNKNRPFPPWFSWINCCSIAVSWARNSSGESRLVAAVKIPVAERSPNPNPTGMPTAHSSRISRETTVYI